MNQILKASTATMEMPGVEASLDLALVSRIYLGASIPTGGWVGQDNFKDFLETEVSPLFPNGYTVLQGAGTWRDEVTHQTIQETSRIIEIAHGYQDLALIREVAMAYKARFDQQAVMVSTTLATISFV